MKKQLLLLLLVIVAANAGYWALNKRFLHDELIAIAIGKSTTSPPFELKSETNQAGNATQAPVDVNVETGSTAVEGEPVQLKNNTLESQAMDAARLDVMIAALKLQIDELELQAVNIDESINMLNEETNMADSKIQEIRQQYQLTPEQLDQVLAENSQKL